MKLEIDKYLKDIIKEVPNKVQIFRKNSDKGKQMVYYTGFFQSDTYNNFTTKQAETIFGKMRNHLNDTSLLFYQRRLLGGGYEYIVRRR